MSIRENTKARAFRAEEGYRIIQAMLLAGWTKANIALGADIQPPYISNVAADKNNVLKDEELDRLRALAKREGVRWKQPKRLV